MESSSATVFWQFLNIAATAIFSLIGSLLWLTYRGIAKRLELLEKIMQEIKEFLATQNLKNDKYDETKKRVDLLEDQVHELQINHRACTNYPKN